MALKQKIVFKNHETSTFYCILMQFFGGPGGESRACTRTMKLFGGFL